MATDAEITEKFWKALKSDMTVMLGVNGVDDGHAQPMTAIVDEEAGGNYLYFFTTKTNTIIEEMRQSDRAIATFVSKGHDVWATINGRLEEHQDRATIDRLWNPHIAAWYEDGKDDPSLQLIRLDPESAQIWLNENSVFAGIKSLLGRDPKKDAQDKIAEVAL
jgi:general stress protein 26